MHPINILKISENEYFSVFDKRHCHKKLPAKKLTLITIVILMVIIFNFTHQEKEPHADRQLHSRHKGQNHVAGYDSYDQ